MKITIGITLTLLIVIIALPISCQYIEEPSRYFENYSKDLHSGAWVPEIFPTDIKNINEQHDIDTNEVWVRFEIGSENIDLANYSMLTEQQKNNINIRKPFMATWWFEGIIEQQPSNDNALNANIYSGSCGNKIAYFAIPKPNTSKYYYWWCQGE